MSNILLLGPRVNKKDSTLTGGAIVLFENLLEQCKKQNINFHVIDTNKLNYFNHAYAYISIIIQLFYHFKSYRHISLHSSKDYIILGLPIVFIGIFFGKSTSLRKFGGEGLDIYTDATGIKKKILYFIYTKMSFLFFEMKSLVAYFSEINPRTFWFPNVRRRELIPSLPKHFSKRFVFIGHIKHPKGVDEFLEASNHFDDSYTFDMFGPIEESKYTKDYFNKYKANYKGSLRSNEVLKKLDSYDVLILPSYKEGYPGIILEAYSLGLPIISTTLPGIKEITENNHTGFLIPLRNVEKLISAIKAFNDSNYPKMSSAAYDKFDEFDADIQTRNFFKTTHVLSTKKIGLITSLDYELFGDGTGIVEREQIFPTNHLKNIVSLYGAKLTILFEYGQFKAFEANKHINDVFEISNAKTMAQLVDLVKSGHDVQLHYHAQWYKALYNPNIQAFDVNLNHVDFTSLEYPTMVEILKEGKKFLEDLLIPVNSNYKCIGFRSGSWAVSDEPKLVKALKECGFHADSSVVPNAKFESEQVTFKYEKCPHNYKYWMVDNFISKQSNSLKTNFFEIPPYTIKTFFAFLKYFNSKYFLSKNIVQRLYSTKICERNFSIWKKLYKILSRDYYMADINTMSYQTLIAMVERAIYDMNTSETDSIIPLMFIGHPKVSYGCDDLHLFYSYLNEHHPETVQYWTYQEAIEYLLEKEASK
jgi:glycosyltransferase involved in cell wall biosynthesis